MTRVFCLVLLSNEPAWTKACALVWRNDLVLVVLMYYTNSRELVKKPLISSSREFSHKLWIPFLNHLITDSFAIYMHGTFVNTTTA